MMPARTPEPVSASSYAAVVTKSFDIAAVWGQVDRTVLIGERFEVLEFKGDLSVVVEIDGRLTWLDVNEYELHPIEQRA